MDRQALVRQGMLALVCVVALAIGCKGRSPEDGGAAQQQGEGGATATEGTTTEGTTTEGTTTEGTTTEGMSTESTSAETHRPVIVGSEATGHTHAIEFPDTVVEGNLDRPPVDPTTEITGETPRGSFLPEATDPVGAAPLQPSTSSGHAFNPLRIGEPEEEPNPLRSMRTFSAPPATALEPSPEFMPETSSESSSAFPTAAADPEFQPMAIDPSGGAPAGAPLAPDSTSPPPTASPFDVVQIFYGTDRAAIDPAADTWPARIVRFLPAAICVLLTLCVVLIAASKRSTALWTVAAVGLLASLGLGYQATAGTLFAIRWHGKAGPQYTVDRAPDGKVQLGVCEVTIPKTHQPGVLEAPSILRMEVREDAAQHVVLSKTERLADEAFYSLLRDRVQASSRKELFVFIHGFDTQFEDAARRTAQIHYDLKFEGAPVFYSWPANNKSILTYPADENTIGWSAPHLKQFLLSIVQQSKAQSINIIAHSMGNRALSTALREIELEFRGQSRLFNHVVLAAPDIDADEFRTNIAPAMQRTANHVTLYASSRDDALRISQLLHRGPRAGDSGRGLVVLPGMDTIDVTAIDSSPWGHVYYGASDPVLQDLKLLFLYSHPPQERTWLSPAQREGLTYWIFEASRTAATGGLVPR
jgi:esterase/lipase superfamily enzyme